MRFLYGAAGWVLCMMILLGCVGLFTWLCWIVGVCGCLVCAGFSGGCEGCRVCVLVVCIWLIVAVRGLFVFDCAVWLDRFCCGFELSLAVGV